MSMPNEKAAVYEPLAKKIARLYLSSELCSVGTQMACVRVEGGRCTPMTCTRASPHGTVDGPRICSCPYPLAQHFA